MVVRSFLMKTKMTNHLVPKAVFHDLDKDYSYFSNQVRIEVGTLLGEAQEAICLKWMDDCMDLNYSQS